MNVGSVFNWLCLSSHYFSYFMLENLNQDELDKIWNEKSFQIHPFFSSKFAN